MPVNEHTHKQLHSYTAKSLPKVVRTYVLKFLQPYGRYAPLYGTSRGPMLRGTLLYFYYSSKFHFIHSLFLLVIIFFCPEFANFFIWKRPSGPRIPSSRIFGTKDPAILRKSSRSPSIVLGIAKEAFWNTRITYSSVYEISIRFVDTFFFVDYN